jgi:flagellar export protein FliJ
MTRFRLAAVLRARLAQEDVARAETVRARGAARAARRTADDQEAVLEATDLPSGAPARAVVAALAARHSLAADLAATRHDITVADAHTDTRLSDLAEAAKRRRIVERLGERHAATDRARDAAAQQRAIDEIAGRRPGGLAGGLAGGSGGARREIAT